MTFTGLPMSPQPYPLTPRSGTDWTEVLDPGERVLWQGRPHPGLMIRWSQVPLLVVGGVFVGLAIWLTAQAVAGLRAGDPAGTKMVVFGTAMIGLGLWAILWPPLSDMARRRGTRYALTDRRALIETDFLGKGLAACPITQDSMLMLKRGSPPSAIFTILRPRAMGLDRLLASKQRKRETLMGFDFIDDAEKVLALMRDIQEESTA